MNIHYKLVNWEFSQTRFSAAITQMHENFSWVELGELLGVSKSTVNNWANGNFSEAFPRPHLSNLLVVCNTLDLDPRDFFVLEDIE